MQDMAEPAARQAENAYAKAYSFEADTDECSSLPAAQPEEVPALNKEDLSKPARVHWPLHSEVLLATFSSLLALLL